VAPCKRQARGGSGEKAGSGIHRDEWQALRLWGMDEQQSNFQRRRVPVAGTGQEAGLELDFDDAGRAAAASVRLHDFSGHLPNPRPVPCHPRRGDMGGISGRGKSPLECAFWRSHSFSFFPPPPGSDKCALRRLKYVGDMVIILSFLWIQNF
jgi:hypothetical protein